MPEANHSRGELWRLIVDTAFYF